MLVLALSALLAGCTTAGHGLTGPTFPSIPVEQVKIFDKVPAEAVVVAKLSVSSASSLTWQGADTAAVRALKRDAAKIGANGIAIDSINHQLWEGATVNATAFRVP